MDLTPIIDDIASQADDFLEGTTRREEARAGINEIITIDHNSLSAADRVIVADAVMRILEDEGFFDSRYAGDALGADDDSESEAD